MRVLILTIAALLMLAARGFCDWTPLQVQLYPYASIPPAADVTGISLNVFGVSGNVYGVQLSGLIFTGSVYGVQVGGVNFVGGSVYGMQTGIVNTSGSVRGVQFGLFNRSRDVSGVQLGLFNYCAHTLKGVQLGFANIGGPAALLPYSIGINIGF